MKDFLKSLKLGDNVIVASRSHGGKSLGLVHQVVKLTATQIILSDKYKYRRDTGLVIGGGRYSHIERIATKADLEADKEKVHKREASQAGLKADFEKRRELEGLFPEDLHASLSSGLGGHGTYELSFHGLTEEKIREIARKTG
jgi:hypothetical protein